MRQYEGTLLFSATDLVNFLGCRHASYLDLRDLANPIEAPPPDDMLRLLAEKGLEHEKAYLAELKARHPGSFVDLGENTPLEVRVARTRDAMRVGTHVIYQGALFARPWHGYSDFLIRVERPSALGAWSYEVWDTKLARSAKPKYVVQLAVYSALVGREQGTMPQTTHVVLGNREVVSLHPAEFRYYVHYAQRRLEAFCANPPRHSTGEPCVHCGVCRWLGLCEEQWESEDDLTLVANIRGSQIEKLQAAGIMTMAELAATPSGMRIANLVPEAFAKVRSQAALQVARRNDGRNRFEILPRVPGIGFDRLPRLDKGDLFFDMEGDPLYADGGLEYLFGFVHEEPDSVRFTHFWGHDRAEEMRAFEAAMDFISARLRDFPNAHIYHYATYEESALKRLAMYHGTREAAVDDLLRRRKLVDLYKVVKDAIRISEPAYSIKNLEVFFAEKREGEVTNAGESIVVYEQWRRLRRPELLKQIAAYNETDCRSTKLCRDWLLKLRPKDAVWFTGEDAEPEPQEQERAARRKQAEERTRALCERLTAGVLEAERPWREVLAHLIDFHRREAKPSWWAMFSRLDMATEELIDDPECLAALRRDPANPPYPDKRSTVHSYCFPPQDFKMAIGDTPLKHHDGQPAGEIVALDEDAGTVSLRVGPSRTITDELSLIPGGPIGDEVLRAAIARYSEAVLKGREGDYLAVTSILRREFPRFTDRASGASVIREDQELLAGAVTAIAKLDRSYLLVQGPPGTGKTYTSAAAIVELLRNPQCRIGVTALSHKAIINLLKQVEELAAGKGVRFHGVKKSSNEDQFLEGNGSIEDTCDNAQACHPRYQLVAGTAWLFARDELNQAFDYLFVDEAGQMSLANVVATGLSARNIVLVGDQMQLSQPIKGAHPGQSGLSALDYLLGDKPTVPPERGVFLPTTRRMNAGVCGFISQAVYEGRLYPETKAAAQHLILRPDADPALKPAGLGFVEVEHAGRDQRCPEEAEQIRALFDNLLRQSWRDADGKIRTLTFDDILVVSPYNMQVNHLQTVLCAGAQVGTVDRFQGQEAAVVLISMATSSGEDMPRDLEFLFSRNRINVAISRARCLAVIVASPHLLDVECRTIEQMRLVNTLCWAKAYAELQVDEVREGKILRHDTR